MANEEYRKVIWDDYHTKICAVCARTTTDAAAARGITPGEAMAEAKELYPKFRAERDARLRELSG